MLINNTPKETVSHVKFIEYTGTWPSLCCGKLTLEIDGETVNFGSKEIHKDVQYEKFWSSGVIFSSEKEEWEINVNDIPEQFRKYAVEIDRIFNDNVEHPCCGGCK